MNSLTTAVQAITPVFLSLGIGIIIRKYHILKLSTFKDMNNLVFYLFIPTNIMIGIYNSRLEINENMKFVILLLFYIVLLFSFLLILGKLLSRKDNNTDFPELLQCLFRSNFIIMGIPILQLLFGDISSGAYAFAISSPIIGILSVVLFNTYTNNNFNVRELLISIVKNPLVLATAIGIFLNISSLSFPTSAETVINTIANSSSVMSLIVMGGTLQFSKFSTPAASLVKVSLIKLIVIPTVFLLLSIPFDLTLFEKAILVLIFGGPTAISAYSLAYTTNGNANLTSEIIMFSTILSILTIPLFLCII